MIPQRNLGRTGLRVSTIGFGAAPLGYLYARLDDETAIATAVAAGQAGVTLFDTSPHYGNGLAEHRVGTALRRLGRDGIVLSTKVGRVMDPRTPPAPPTPGVISPGFAGGLPHAARFDYSFDGTLRAFEQSLLRLGTDRIDLLLIHDIDVWTHGAEAIEGRIREAMEGAYRALERLRGEGVLKGIGIGVNESDIAARLAEAGDFDTMLLAGRYSLLEQPALEQFMPIAERRGMGIMLGGVFNSGILATGAVPGARYNYAEAPPEIMDRVRRIEAVCAAHATPLARAALQFPLGHASVSSVVLGAVTPDEICQNVAAIAEPVPAALWADLKAEGLLDVAAPVPA